MTRIKQHSLVLAAHLPNVRVTAHSPTTVGRSAADNFCRNRSFDASSANANRPEIQSTSIETIAY
jgi:hypothetical protein